MTAVAAADRPLLDVVDVCVRYGGVWALQAVTFSVAEGALHAVIGPNGAGKSTLLNVLTGVTRPTRGYVRLRDTVLTDHPLHAMAGMGVARAFQNIALFPEISVEDNLMLGRHHLMRSGLVRGGLRLPGTRREERRHRERVREIAGPLGLTSLLDLPAGRLSYGDQKRVELARALCVEARLLLLDEPLAGMNAAEKRDVVAAIQHCHDELGVTVVLVDHDMGLVMEVATRVTVLDFGRRIADGTPEAVSADPEVLRAYLGTNDATT